MILFPMTKYTEEFVERIVQWVEEKGLTDDYGASLKQLCDHFAINKATFERWMEKSDFCTRIKKTKEVFKDNREVKVVKSLFSLAEGGIPYKKKKVRREFQPTEDGSAGRLVKLVEETEEGVTQPNLGAQIMILTNIAPDKWKNRQNNTHDGAVSVDWQQLLSESKEPNKTPPKK